MGYFKDETLVVDIPADKAQQVFEKITGEYGKIIREDYNIKPFTGTIKDGSFSIIPNLPGLSVKLKGTFESEGMGKTRINISGSLLVGRLIVLVFFLVCLLPIGGLIGGLMFVEDGSLVGLCMIGVLALITAAITYSVMKFPRSCYNLAILELMRKMDNHELVL